MQQRFRHGSTWLALAWLLVSTTPALAQSGALERGLELREAGRDDEALEVFESLYEREPEPRVLVQIALAEQALGRWIDAEAHLEEALQRPDDWVAARREVLESALEDIRQHLGWLELRGAPEGSRVSVDGREAAVLPLQEPLRLVAGSVVVEVAHPEHHPWSRPVAVPAGGRARERVTLVPLGETAEPTASDEGGGPGPSIAGWTAFGLALAAGGGLGVTLGLRETEAIRFNDELNCGTENLETMSEDCRSAASTVGDLEVASAVLAASAGTAAAVAVALWVAAASGDDAAQARILCLPTLGGAACRGRF
jgi:tetratricopeptide (TPR) repeat protein